MKEKTRAIKTATLMGFGVQEVLKWETMIKHSRSYEQSLADQSKRKIP
jgi:hypothetical protein